MTRTVLLNTVVVATSIRPLFARSTAARRLVSTPHSTIVNQFRPRHFSTTLQSRFSQNHLKMGVHNLADESSFESSVIKGDGLILVDFFATWCGPCKAIAPTIVKFSDAEEFANVKFYKIDVDEVPEVSASQGIRAMPTFFLYKNGEKVEEVVGANPKAIEDALKKHK